MNIVYERVRAFDRLTIPYHLMRGRKVYVIEPFYIYHHQRNIVFYPDALPGFAMDLVKVRRIFMIQVDSFPVFDIHRGACNKAVENVESVYLVYRKKYARLIEEVIKALKSEDAEDIFKKRLCDRLACFYSFNDFLFTLQKELNQEKFFLYPDIDVYEYRRMKNILKSGLSPYKDDAQVYFPISIYFFQFFLNLCRSISLFLKILAYVVLCGFIFPFRKIFESCVEKKKYIYGVAVMNVRQLYRNNRGPDFIMDEKKIFSKDMAYLLDITLSENQKSDLAKFSGQLFFLPKPWECRGGLRTWARAVMTFLSFNIFHIADEMFSTAISYFKYFSWKDILRKISLKHFITHCDFGITHISRNIALKQAGVKTWYYTDSMNFGSVFENPIIGQKVLHPFLVYLHYDHFVTWDYFILEYFERHPGRLAHKHVVGCLWSSHSRRYTPSPFMEKISLKMKEAKSSFLISVFDSSFTKNSFTPYQEGVLFAKHILSIAEENLDVFILFKEKNERSCHKTYDVEFGHQLIELYNVMAKHPRIIFLASEYDSSEAIANSWLVISFPFTSTTYEALSINKLSIWHDAMGYYRQTYYGQIKDVVTHGYQELRDLIVKLKNQNGVFKNPVPEGSKYLDPYRDGQALDRFRELLTLTNDRHPNS